MDGHTPVHMGSTNCTQDMKVKEDIKLGEKWGGGQGGGWKKAVVDGDGQQTFYECMGTFKGLKKICDFKTLN